MAPSGQNIYFRPVLYWPTINGRHSKNIDFPAPMLWFDPAVARYMAYTSPVVTGSRMYMANGFVMRTEGNLDDAHPGESTVAENSPNNVPNGAVIIDLIHFDFVILRSMARQTKTVAGSSSIAYTFYGCREHSVKSVNSSRTIRLEGQRDTFSSGKNARLSLGHFSSAARKS